MGRFSVHLHFSKSKVQSKQLETKASSYQGQCIQAGYCHAHMLLYASGVNYNVNSNYTKYFAQPYAAEFLRFGIFPPQISDSCGATYQRNCKMFSALQSASGPLTNNENSVQIDAQLATPSFLKLVRN